MSDKKDEFLEEESSKEEGEEKKEEEEQTEGEEAPEKIKVGEEEYTQEELDRLVKLGKIGVEAEEKYDTKIDRIWPEFTTKSQKLKELEQRIETRETEEIKAKEGKELTEEEQKKIARAEAKKLGIVLDEDLQDFFDKRYSLLRTAEQLRDDSEDVALDGFEKYGIKTTGRELLEYMQERGIRNPDDAFELKFKSQIKSWEEKELAKQKGTGLITEESSTAGAKEPTETKATRETLKEHIAEALKGGGEE